jgi:hypothetical protein
MTNIKQIGEILGRYGEPEVGNVWRVQGQAVIYHKTLERIAAQADICFDLPNIIRAEADEAVILVTGHLGERMEWSIGEAKVNVNYRVTGRQAAYVYAMAEKRAKDRVILKLIGLHGLLYSEDEADDFKNGRPDPGPEPEPEAGINFPVSNGKPISAHQARKDNRWPPLIDSLRACGTMEALYAWNDEHEGDITDLPHGWIEELREEWRSRAREIKTR